MSELKKRKEKRLERGEENELGIWINWFKIY